MEMYRYCPYCGSQLSSKTIEGELLPVCTNCDFIYWKNPKPVVSVIIIKNRKVLLLKRSHEPFKNYWVLPGGFIKAEETPEESIIRETKEETGLSLTVNKLVAVHRIDDDPRGIHIDIIYEGTAKGNVRLSPEDSDFKYFSEVLLPEKIAYKHRQVITERFIHKL